MDYRRIHAWRYRHHRRSPLGPLSDCVDLLIGLGIDARHLVLRAFHQVDDLLAHPLASELELGEPFQEDRVVPILLVQRIGKTTVIGSNHFPSQ